MKCPHGKCFAAKWVAKILLYLTYVIQCPPIRVMINYWDHDLGMFDLQGDFLEITLQ